MLRLAGTARPEPAETQRLKAYPARPSSASPAALMLVGHLKAEALSDLQPESFSVGPEPQPQSIYRASSRASHASG